MKGTKVDARVAAAAVALGSIGGGLLGYVLARSRARREYAARLDQAVAEVKAHYARPVFAKPNAKAEIVEFTGRRTWAGLVKNTLSEPVHDDLEGIDDGPVDGDAADEDSGGGRNGAESEGTSILQVLGAESPEAVGEPDGPFQITEAAFGELNDEGFQTISVTYYSADKVLVDDKDDPIRDKIGTIGTSNPLGFSQMGDDPQIRYVRNRRLEVDFEILLDARSFAETVLGYGQPNRRREASPAATAE